jgi:hypothetical protein
MPDELRWLPLAAWALAGFAGRAYWKHRDGIRVINGARYLDVIDCAATGTMFGPFVWVLGWVDSHWRK